MTIQPSVLVWATENTKTVTNWLSHFTGSVSCFPTVQVCHVFYPYVGYPKGYAIQMS
jgi:hypothetical protein